MVSSFEPAAPVPAQRWSARVTAGIKAMALVLAFSLSAAHAAVFTIADGDVAGLIAAINTSNGNNQPDVINLAAGGTYTLTVVNNTMNGPNGLPVVTGDSAQLTINGNGAVIRRAAAAPDMRVLRVATGTSVTLNNLRLENGRTTDAGGAIRSDGALSLFGCELNNNFAQGNAGAILAQGGSLSAFDTLFSGNESGDNGGAVLGGGGVSVLVTVVRSQFSDNIATAVGGGLAAAGTSVIRDSLFVGNTAVNGGGIFSQGQTDLIGSTLSGNFASTAGGGLAMPSGTVRIDQSTITANQALAGGGGVFRNAGEAIILRLRNSIVAGNVSSQVSGALTTGSTNNVTGGNPGLGALRNNGGPLATHALLPSSSSIDAGNSALVPAGSFDMRGYPRISGAQVDIGAVEFQQPLLLQTSGSGQSAPLLTAFANPLRVTATEASGVPVVGMQISYSAPGSGPSASFTGGSTLTTDAAGSVQTTAVANAIPGSYAIGAATVGLGLSASTNFAVSNIGSDLSVSLSTTTSSAVPGLSVSYTLVVTNPGPAAVNAVNLSNLPPAVLDCNWTSVATGGASGNGDGTGDLTESLNMPANSSVTYTIPCTIDPGASGTLVNTASISAVGDVNPANNSASVTDTLEPSADISISKSNGVSTLIPGSVTVYTITASNAGPSNAPGTVITDSFPAECSGVSWNCTGANGGTCASSGSGNIDELANLPVGASVSYLASCNIDPMASGTLINTASAMPAAGISDPDLSNNSATDSDTLQVLPVLSINDVTGLEGTGSNTAFEFTVSLSEPALAGGVRFDIATANGTALAGVDYLPLMLVDQLIPEGESSHSVEVMVIGDSVLEPTETFFVNVSNLRGASAGKLQGTGTILDDDTSTTIISSRPDPSVVGQPYLVTVEVRSFAEPPSGAVMVQVGTAADAASCGPATLSPFSAVATRASCEISSLAAAAKLELSAEFIPDPGDLTGSRGSAFHSIIAADTAISVSGPTRARINTPTLFDFDLEALAPGGGVPSGIVTLSTTGSSCVVEVPGETSACELSLALGSNTIEASFVSIDGNHVASTSTGVGNAQTVGFVLADMAVSKTTTLESYLPGDLLVYTITLQNLGPDAAADLRVLDIAPSELVDVLWTCSSSGGASCPQSGGSGDIDVQLPSFPVGDLQVYTLSGNVAGSPLQIINTASIELPANQTVEDPDLSNNSASVLLSIDEDLVFADGFEGVAVAAEAGEYQLPSATLRPLLDHNAQVVFSLNDSFGEAGRVYARALAGSVQYAVAQRDSQGSLRLSSWRSSFKHEPTLRWSSVELESGWMVSSLTLD